MTQQITDGPVLDHLALASRRAWDNVIRYCAQLGGSWLGGPTNTEDGQFYFCQIGFDGGTKIELLEPYDKPESDFITRFLHRNGPGPHHLTFKVPNIEQTMGAARGAGYDIVGENLADPDWKEAFLHPKQSHGIVIQLAQQGQNAGWDLPQPLPPTDQGANTVIESLTHLVADLGKASALFSTVLGMQIEEDEHDHPLGKMVVLSSGPWTLRLVSPTAPGPVQWLGNRTGRLLQVNMSVDHLGALPSLRPIPGGYELSPEQNLGTRLLLRQNSTD